MCFFSPSREKSIADKDNISDLLLSMDELQNTPDAGKTVVQVNVDYAMDSKEDERQAVISMIKILFEKKKLSSDDIQQPIGELVEFMDSFVVDSPHAMKYFGNMVAEFLAIKALNLSKLCEDAKKLEENSAHVIPSVIEEIIKSFSSLHGVGASRSIFNATPDLMKLLGADKWDEMAKRNKLC